jgi:hypothetical protein
MMRMITTTAVQATMDIFLIDATDKTNIPLIELP